MSQSDNKLLAALPRRDYQRLQPLLRTLHLPAETGLPHCGHTRVYFPGTGLCSIITKMADGGGIEVACIGNEGVVGLHSLDAESLHDRNGFVQVADGTVQYMPAVLFERERARDGRFRELIDTFSYSFLETMIQAVACNRLHTTEERCCRWLLGVHDRLGRARFELKARFLARAMGVKNSAIAAMLTSLEEQGLARHDGLSITILDTIGLRRRACRCYDAMKRGYALERVVAASKEARPQHAGRVLPMPLGHGACTLCGSSIRVPHRNGHECILALDEEIGTLVRRTHILRKYRAQLMANRAQLYRDILKRSNARV
jgi:Crp-like helix-turn-helix domain